MHVTVVWPHPGGFRLDKNLFKGHLNMSQVLLESLSKVDLPVGVMSCTRRIHKQKLDSHARWKKQKNMHNE